MLETQLGWLQVWYELRSDKGEVIGAAINIHRKLGPGLLESAYEACLAHDLQRMGFRVERQKPVPLVYDDVKLECGFRADLVVDNTLTVELKCKEAIHPVDEAQLVSHMPLFNLPLGLLINFHVVLLKTGIRRFVNNYTEPKPELVVKKPLTAKAFNRKVR